MAFLGFENIMRNHDAEEKTFRAFCPGKMDPDPWSLDYNFLLHFHFVSRRTKERAGEREKVGERGGNCEWLDYSGRGRQGGGEGGNTASLSLLARKKKRCLK